MSSVCFPIALATSLFWHQKSIQVAILVWKIELIFDTALNKKTCSLLTVSCCVTKAMSSSKILSYMFFICWRFVHRTRAGFKLIAEVIQKIPVSSSGSAAVTERKYSRVPPSLVRYSTSCWGSFSAISCPIVALKAACFCIFQDVPITLSSSGFIVMFLACVSFCFLGLSACLSFLLLSFRFNFCSFCFLFCFLGCSLRFLAFLGVT